MSGIATVTLLATPPELGITFSHLTAKRERKWVVLLSPKASLCVQILKDSSGLPAQNTSWPVPPVTHTIFHDASAFPARVQVLTKSQLEDVMGGKCVSKRTPLHTVSYKVFSSLLPDFLLQL